MINQFLTPVIAKRGVMPASQARAYRENVALVKDIKTRRRLRKTSPKENPYDPAAFDWRAHASFLDHWQDELETLDPHDREALENKVMPYFCGAALDENWFSILRGLKEIRQAEANRYVPKYIVPHGRGAIADGY